MIQQFVLKYFERVLVLLLVASLLVINSLIEQMDMRDAQRSYEANLNVITATRRMITRTLDMLRA